MNKTVLDRPTQHMKYTMHLPERPFYAIKNGTKKVEGRVPKSKRSRYFKIKSGDTIVFLLETGKERVQTQVLFVHHYPDFRTMLQKEGPEKVLSSGGNIDQGVASYNSFSGYKEGVKKYGVFAFGIKAK